MSSLKPQCGEARNSRLTLPHGSGLGGRVPPGRRIDHEQGSAPSFHDGVQGVGCRAPVGAGRHAGRRGRGAGGHLLTAQGLAALAGGDGFGRGHPASEDRGGGASRAPTRESPSEGRKVECAPLGGHDQSVVLTGARALRSSNVAGLRYSWAECRRLSL